LLLVIDNEEGATNDKQPAISDQQRIMVFLCLHCRTQNFATLARLRQAKDIPLACWKCGKELTPTQSSSEKRTKRTGSVKKK